MKKQMLLTKAIDKAACNVVELETNGERISRNGNVN